MNEMVAAKVLAKVAILAYFYFYKSVQIAKGVTIVGDDPWYKKARYYWSFNSLQERGVVDQRRTSSVPAYSKNGLQLNHDLGSWADLGNCSNHCIKDPDACDTGFTVSFWLRVNDYQRDKVIMQIASATKAVGTKVELNGDFLGVHVNSRTIQRHLQVKWPYSSWNFVALTWNKTKNEINVLLNSTPVAYVKNIVEQSYDFASVLPYHTLILGVNNARIRSIRMIIDELALWKSPLSIEELRYVMKSKAVDGGFTNWSEFSSCTVSCGQGTKTRTRNCTNPLPQHGGNYCKGRSTHSVTCFLRHCPINGNYTEWTEFTSCSLTCGGGKRNRGRTCSNPRPQYGGLNCSSLGPAQEGEDCNTHACPIDGGYSEWSTFGACSASCGNGLKRRTRLCNSPPPQYGGMNCSIIGPAQETRVCFIKLCPVDGNYSNWSSFGSCSKSCGVGEKSRTRKCDNPVPVGEGRNCSHIGPSIDIQPCNTQPCPRGGGYTPWSDFSPCTASCGGGTRFRRRNCTNPPPAAGGRDCARLGSSEETNLCNTYSCPVDGGYGEWSQFSQCTQTCGGGEKKRSRSCNNPAPESGGRNCSGLGPAQETQSCSNNKCPGISFLAPVTFPEETFNTDLLSTESPTFKALAERVKYNVFKIFGENSALESVDVSWCGKTESGGSGVLCVIRFGFVADRYAGVIRLQDALLKEKLLYRMPVQARYLTTSDVPSNAPENVKAHNTSSRSINVTWSEIQPQSIVEDIVLGYRLTYADDKKMIWNHLVPGKNRTHFELNGLDVYTEYCVRVMAYNRRGDGLASDPVCAYTDTDVPDRAPSNVFARNLSATELLVKWEPLPKESYHSVLLAYRVNIKTNEINYTRIINVPPNATNHRITGLDTYTRYVVSVAAVNDVGQGVYSDDVIVWTEEGVPSQAPNVSEIFYTSSTSIRVTWEPLSPHFVQGRLLGYRVVYRQVDGENWEKWKAITTGNRKLGTSITGLKKYGAYVVQVGAFTRKGNGLLSKGYILRTDEDVPSKPPQNVTVAKDNSTSTSLFIHWRSVPANHQNGIILGYRIMYKKFAGEDTLRTKNVSARTTATELKNLTKFTEYSITILAYTSKGSGVRAKFFTASTTEDRPSKPPTLTRVFNTSSTSIRVHWSTIPQKYTNGILVGFVLLYRAMNESQDMYRDVEVEPDRNNVELTGLWKYTKYGIRVLGFTRVGWGVISPEVAVQTDEDAPGMPPENVYVANKSTPTTIPVTWQPISNQYFVHGILRGYTVTYRAISNPNQRLEEKERNITVGPNTTSVVLNKLSSFTIYSIEVRAFTVKGNGIPSQVIFAETCNCYSTIFTNYWLNPPYMDKDSDGDQTGIFPPILRQLVRSCCGDCAAHGYTEIDFHSSGDNASASKSTEKEVREDIDDATELSFPVYGRMDQMKYSKEYGFAPLVQSAGVAFIVGVDEPGTAAKMVVKAVFSLWPLIITVFISAFFAGIVMWSLDFVFNANEFPASPVRGPIEGMWWAFVTMTTLGYGDRVPRAIHSKLFGIVWIMCGLVIIALVMSFITTSLTMDIIKSNIPVYGSKVAAISDSAEYRLGIRMNAKMSQGYTTLKGLHTALTNRHVDGILIDSYTVGSRKELFNDGLSRVGKMIDYSSAYGIVMAGYAKKLQKCFRGFLKEEKAVVFEIITSNVQGITGLQKKNAASKTEGLFDAESPAYIKSITYCGISIAVLVFIFLIYEIVTRKKRNPNPKRYEYSDYLQDLHKEDRLYEYNNTKDAMKKILSDFYKNCCFRIENLKAKHRRELRLLARLKQEATEKGEITPTNGSLRKISRGVLGFTPRYSSIVQVNGFSH